jgi:hypothetical protein
MIRPKFQNFKIGHDGILSIGNFILMIKNNILLFQLPGNLPTTKKCAPYFRGNTEFPIYFLLPSYMEYIEIIGFTPKILKNCFSKIMVFTDKT